MHKLREMYILRSWAEKIQMVDTTSCDNLENMSGIWHWTIGKVSFNFTLKTMHFPSHWIFWKCNLPSHVECLQYNNRLHMTVCFINFSRHSITADRAHGTGLIILTQNSSHWQWLANHNSDSTLSYSKAKLLYNYNLLFPSCYMNTLSSDRNRKCYIQSSKKWPR